MKKILTFFSFFSIVFGACNKNTAPPTIQSYMRFKLNGVQVECDSKFGASYKPSVGVDADISFYANWGDNALDFQLFTYTSDIVPGQYVFAPQKAYYAEIWPAGTLTTPGTHPSYVAGSGVPNSSIAGSGQITITEINVRYIKGSFDFITDINPQTGLFMTVTDGVFYIKRG